MDSTSQTRHILLVANRGGTNIGGAFERALPALGYAGEMIEMRRAMTAPALVRRFNWYVRGRRPTHLGSFGREVRAHCQASKPRGVIATGVAPLDVTTLRALADANVVTANYLTDDPWSPAQYAPWFLQALPHYTMVFTPRRANMDDLKRLGCKDVRYLPFGYDPEWHFPQACVGDETQASDIFFAGGADADRVPFLAVLVRAKLRVGLYGDYWARYPETRSSYRGYATPEMVRCAVSRTKVCLCLVRRSNRDDHVMRTFEIPAMRGCALMEETEMHRTLLGVEGSAALYFKSPEEELEKTQWLVAHPAERERMAQTAYQIVVNGNNTYRDRLATMVQAIEREQA